jgi:hypothetical protein
VAPIITGIIIHFRFHFRYISMHKLLYFNFFSASFCTTFLSAGMATSISVHVFFLLFLIIIFGLLLLLLLLLYFQRFPTSRLAGYTTSKMRVVCINFRELQHKLLLFQVTGCFGCLCDGCFAPFLISDYAKIISVWVIAKTGTDRLINSACSLACVSGVRACVRKVMNLLDITQRTFTPHFCSSYLFLQCQSHAITLQHKLYTFFSSTYFGYIAPSKAVWSDKCAAL